MLCKKSAVFETTAQTMMLYQHTIIVVLFILLNCRNHVGDCLVENSHSWPFGEPPEWRVDRDLLEPHKDNHKHDKYKVFGHDLTCKDMKKIQIIGDRLSHGSAKGVWKYFLFFYLYKYI